MQQGNVSKQKTILVTGGAGFIGSHLCERLVADGHTVISLDNYFTGSRENHVQGVEYREGHTKDIATLVPEVVDMVYHLGEYSRVEKSFEDVEMVWDLNQAGTIAVLEYCRARDCKLVYAGSSTKFGDNGLGRDQSPYAWSKASMTELVKNYGDWFGLQYSITYFYNVYGPRESSSAFGTVVAIFRDQYAHGAPITVVSPGTQQRIFTHVDDIVQGLLVVGERGEGDGYGIGGEDLLTIRELAELFSSEVIMLPERQGNRHVAAIDTAKIRSLGWQPQESLRKYIADFIASTTPKPAREKRIIVFSTTFYPVTGPAEDALIALAKKMPGVHFDVVAAACGARQSVEQLSVPNITVHSVGTGSQVDKYLLSILGKKKALELAENHSYLFAWSLMASYGALPAIALRRKKGVPLLVTLADQRLSWGQRFFLRLIMGSSDQVYASLPEQHGTVKAVRAQKALSQEQRSLGVGDSLANQVRFAYSHLLRSHTSTRTRN